jgi:hypothetical protein
MNNAHYQDDRNYNRKSDSLNLDGGSSSVKEDALSFKEQQKLFKEKFMKELGYNKPKSTQ